MTTIRALQHEFSRLIPQSRVCLRLGHPLPVLSVLREVVDFRHKLNSLGAQNISNIPPSACRNIDQTVAVSAARATEFRREMQRIRQLFNGS